VPQELRALSSVTFDSQGTIIRWVDYWDGRSALIQNSDYDSSLLSYAAYQSLAGLAAEAPLS
jgi:hypothetical protein